jgi:hypothetical protein
LSIFRVGSSKGEGSETMSLKEKAKTTTEIVKWALEIKPGESKPYIPLEKVVEWVRLEDAEQALLDRLIPLEQQISILEKESSELKQKLQQRMKEYEEICQDSETDYVRRCSFLEETFEELLKEEKVKP